MAARAPAWADASDSRACFLPSSRRLRAASAALAALAVLPPLAVLAELGLLDGEARLCRELQRRRVEALRALDLLFAAEVLELLRGLAADRPPPGLD